MKMIKAAASMALMAALPGAALAQSWATKANPGNFTAAAMELMTDGTVMVQGLETSIWYRLIPDSSGSYVNGTWKQAGSLPTGYAPLYNASAVLPDGRLIINGGEYNGQGGGGVWTTLGAIYDPLTDSWKNVKPPAGWTTIGDAQSTLLPDGTYMLANCCTTQEVLLNAQTMAWTPTGTGKADINDEEGWTLLPDGTVLTVDTNNTADPKHTEIYSKGTWKFAGDTVDGLPDVGSHEMGPQVLRPNGTVFAAGADGHTGVYNLKTKKWLKGPDFPNKGGQLDIADGPGGLEPDGHVLVAASPGVFNPPTSFYEFDGKKLVSVPAFANAATEPSYQVHMLVLPNGQIMATDFGSNVYFFTSPGKADAKSVPKIQSIASTLTHGQSYTLTGVGLNGKSQGAGYGDDFQASTNYPLVRITNVASGHVVYARTTGFSSMAVANPKPVTASVAIPAAIETGASELVAVANGIPSLPVSVTVN